MKPTILVLTRSSEDPTTVGNIKEACKDLGLTCRVILSKHAYVGTSNEKGMLEIFNYNGEGKKITVDPDNSVCLIRGSAIIDQAGLTLIKTFESIGLFCINTLESMMLCRNKLATNISLSKHNLKIPPASFITDENTLDLAIENIGGEYPIVLKVLTGAEGIGVVFCDSYKSLKSSAQALWKQGADLLIQKYMPIKFDVRSLVLDGKVLASMKRSLAKDDFRSNVALGGKSEPYKLSEKEKDIVEKVAKVCGAFYCGVDTIIVDDEIFVLEVNGSPGSGAVYRLEDGTEVKGKELIKKVISHISDKENWRVASKEAGIVEYITLDGVDKVSAKLDTGNSGFNVLHAHDIKVDGDYVEFKTIDDKKFRKSISGYSRVRAHNNIVERRPLVSFDIEFNGRKYTDIEFTLSNRENNSYGVLIGSKFMIKYGFTVNPGKEFNLVESRAKKLSKLTTKF
jgi:ribosomal protein S6--L-glutamate ligase